MSSFMSHAGEVKHRRLSGGPWTGRQLLATEVKSWSMLDGRTRDALTEVGTANRTVFETFIDVRAPASTRYLALQAVDRSGAPLRASGHCTNPNDPACSVSGTRQPDAMGHHTAGEIPNYWTYAEDFVLDDHMFEAVSSRASPKTSTSPRSLGRR